MSMSAVSEGLGRGQIRGLSGGVVVMVVVGGGNCVDGNRG